VTATDGALLAADIAARRDALDVNRSFIVQAPAGSGKTELLIQRYLRLLGTVAEPEEVLAITFTRKAAAEMRLRVVDALRDADAGIAPAEAHRQVTAAAARRVLERDRDRSWGVLDNPARLRIQTLDALNMSIARMLPISAGGGGTATIIEGEAMNRLYRQAAAATLEWLGSGGETGDTVRSVFEHMDANTNIYVSQLAAMLGTRDQWLPFVGSGRLTDEDAARLRASIETRLTSIIERAIGDVAATLPREFADDLAELAAHAAGNLADSGNPEHAICGFGTEPVLPGAGAEDVGRWLALSELVLTGGGTVRKQVNVSIGFPPADKDAKARMKDLLDSLAERFDFIAALDGLRGLPPPRYDDAQWDVLRHLFRLLPIAIVEWRRLCAAQGATDHIEIALAASGALGTADAPGDVALLLDYEIRHILVDEMQDTSKAQYRMLEALTGGWSTGDGRTLFCVGDPMQSIYRFRNAEVTQFLGARQRGIGAVPLESLVLRQNFRSGSGLVDWFNAVFPSILPPRDDALYGAIRYAPCVPAPALVGFGECHVHPVFGADVAREAAVGGELIERLSHDHPDDTIAILVRGRTQLPTLLRALRDAGVAYQAVEIDRLTDLPEVIDVLALTRALAHEADRIAWLALLRGAWIGLDWTDLHALVVGDRRSTLPELLRDEERLAALSADGRAAIERALPILLAAMRPDRKATLRQRVERAWIALGGPAMLRDAAEVDNVYRFLDAIGSLESAGTLSDVAELEDMLDGVRASTSTPARVQVMTMHKSKGLQFDHVVLFGLGRQPRNESAPLLGWVDIPTDDGDNARIISAIGRRDDVEHDPLHQFIGRMSKDKGDHETGRLLYVACTRAKRSLHLVGHVLTKDGGLRAPARSTLLYRLWAAVEPAYRDALDADGAGADNADDPLFVMPPLRRLAKPWMAPQAALPVARPAEPDAPAAPPVEFDWVGHDARLAGTLVHRWLQRYADGRESISDGIPEDFARRNARWLHELGASSAAHASIIDRVRGAVANVLADETGRWLLAGEGDAELALTGVVDGARVSIVIDRVLIDADGTHWIVDYKTSSHEGGDLDGFLASEVRRYRPQLDRYATVYAAYASRSPRCALYFPLLGRFVEVPTLQ